MKKVLCVLGVLCIVGFLSRPYAAAQAVVEKPAAVKLVFAGSGGNLLLTRALADGFMREHPDILIEVPESIGSRGGIRVAAEGAVVVGLVSRELKGEEKELGLTVTPYARTGVVFGAHSEVSESGITFEDIVDIYKGTKSSWKDGREIIVLTREPGDSSIELLARTVPGFSEAYAESWKARRWTALFTDQEMEKTLRKVPNAIGLADMGYARAEASGIKALSINGAPATLESLSSGEYPFVKTLSFVYLGDRLPEEARLFIEYAQSEEAVNMMRDAGYLPAE